MSDDEIKRASIERLLGQNRPDRTGADDSAAGLDCFVLVVDWLWHFLCAEAVRVKPNWAAGGKLQFQPSYAPVQFGYDLKNFAQLR